MIEIRQLRYAVMTADTQSFSRAAATHRMKQSTLSRRNFRYWIALLGDLGHRISFKLATEIGFSYCRLLSSKGGSRAFRNPAAIHSNNHSCGLQISA
jgi:hypothetical protein